MRLLTAVMLVAAVAAGSGCKKKSAPASAAAAAPAQPAAPPIDDRNTNFRAGGSEIGNAYRAGKRTLALSDMSQLGVLIEAEYSLNGRMPTADAIKTFLRKDAPHLLRLIDDGTILLTGTTKHEGMWAYEIDADRAGGVVLVAGRANRATADEVKQYLAQK